MDTRTKIVATLGPASEAPAVLDELLRAGVDVVRLNLSHGTLASHIARLHAVREAADRVDQVVAVLADLPGPKVRSGQFAEGGCELVPGSLLVLAPGEGASDDSHITVDYPTLLADLQGGDKVVLGDGAISLQVTHVTHNVVHCMVLTGGHVQGRPGCVSPRPPTTTSCSPRRWPTKASTSSRSRSCVRRTTCAWCAPPSPLTARC
jgi:pyruvate kinase